MKAQEAVQLHIMAIDCCQHVLAALKEVPLSALTAKGSKDKARPVSEVHDVDLIVIGVSRYPVRRLFVSQLRQVYPGVPLLVLRRSGTNEGAAILGEFILSAESGAAGDLEMVSRLRKVLPIQPCHHAEKVQNYDTVRDVLRIISENYATPDLQLADVARELSLSQVQLSRILNQQVGVSFRQLLRNTRIEEAKRMLASGKYSVKEVAVRVGFVDSHYFSRSFKELTGLSASEYRSRDAIFD
ncbi:MAG TPA: AraC family transcriptional regulator [Pyrinomonadaceae bacterium]|nr:AraC family transcriptional regulator [Pyrinomonadaceae bacterium]